MNDNAKKSILVIDDDITIRKLISHHLNLHNYKVFLASSSAEGFEQLYNNNIDLVLCDIIMDNMDGFTYCQLVREKEKYRSLPFVFVTAKNTLEDKSKALEVGGDDFITKPFNVDELIIKVKALIRRTEINRIYGTRKNLNEIFSEKTPKVIIVDDDKSTLTIYQTGLQKAGVNCLVAIDANEGFMLAKSFQPDLIVADIMMPGIDGFKFRDMLLRDRELASIPFIFLSNIGSEQGILDGFDKDITDYLTKDKGYKIVVAKIISLIKSLHKERTKVISELQNASDALRASVVPEQFPEFDKFMIRYWHVPFTGIPGGDFIDHFLLDENHLVVLLGDVMGKKWGAWYFAYAYAGYIRSAIHSVISDGDVSSPGKIISKVNNLVYQDSKISEVFSTLSIVILDNKNMTLNYSGAGDMPIIIKKKSTGELKKIESKGLLLGFKSNTNYDDILIQMSPGDAVLISSDGMVECRDAQGKIFGVSGLVKSIQREDFDERPIEILKDEIKNFNQLKFEDDLSVIAISAK